MRGVRMGREAAAETVGAAYNLQYTAYNVHRTTPYTEHAMGATAEEVRAAAGEG